MRGVAEPRLERRALQAHRPHLPVVEALDPRVLVTEADAAREQHQGGLQAQAAEVDRESLAHHRTATGYWAINGSGVRRTIWFAIAWQTSIRSKGSA